MKVQVKTAFKSYSFFFFFTRKTKKQRGFALIFAQTPIQVSSRHLTFKISKSKSCVPYSAAPSFSKNISNTRSGWTKWLTKIVLITTKLFWINLNNKSSQISIVPLRLHLSQQFLVNFQSNQYIPPWLGKTFKFMVFRLLENSFRGHRIEFMYFYFCKLAKRSLRFLSSPPRQRETLLIPSKAALFEKSFPSSRE